MGFCVGGFLHKFNIWSGGCMRPHAAWGITRTARASYDTEDRVLGYRCFKNPTVVTVVTDNLVAMRKGKGTALTGAGLKQLGVVVRRTLC